MKPKEFVKATVCDLEQSIFEELKCSLLGEYIQFFIIDNKDVNKYILAEKLCDWFNQCMITSKSTFDEILKAYLDAWDCVIKQHIPEEQKAKNEPKSPIEKSRARLYYEKAISIKNQKLTMCQLVDYSRIMLCLYSAVIKNESEYISNFDFSADCLHFESILKSIKSDNKKVKQKIAEKILNIVPVEKAFDETTQIITLLMLCTIESNKIEGVTAHE